MFTEEINRYYSGMYNGYRLYPLGALFNRHDAIWNFKRQWRDTEYDGPDVTEYEFEEQIKIRMKH